MNTVADVATIAAFMLALFGMMIGWLSAQRKFILSEIRRSVNEVVVLLTEKLETKEKVAELAQKVAVLNAKLDQRSSDSR